MASELNVGGILISDGSNDVELQMGNSSYGIEFDYSAGDFKFKTNGTTKMTLADIGLATFTNGISVTGGGIKFPATQSQQADANTLDDYEEGTWTPTLPNGGTLTVNYASYTRIGQQVTCHFFITAVAPTADTSVFTIGGLPFTCSDVANAYPAGTIGYVGDGDWTAVGLVGSVNTATFKFHDLDGSNVAVTNNGAIAKWNGSVDQMLCQLTYIVK